MTGAERRAERLVREAVGGFSVGAIHIAADESVIGWRAIAAMRIDLSGATMQLVTGNIVSAP